MNISLFTSSREKHSFERVAFFRTVTFYDNHRTIIRLRFSYLDTPCCMDGNICLSVTCFNTLYDVILIYEYN